MRSQFNWRHGDGIDLEMPVDASESGLGRGTLILVDGHVIVLGDQGKLVVAEAKSEGFKALGELQLPAEGRYWTSPAFSDGRIFIRNATGDVLCVDVRN